jgi:Prohead core protein serine protease
MKLIRETVENVKSYLTEDANGQKTLFIEGPMLIAERKNKNGRIYPKHVLKKEVDRYMTEFVKKNRAFGELGHPETPTINLDRVSHMVVDLKEDGNQWVGKAKILDTPMGNIARKLIEGGGQLGVSSRGMGSLKDVQGTNYVQDDYYLATAADIVADPSAPGAFVRGIMENKEWVWDNGIIKEADINVMKKSIERAKRKQLEDVKLRMFENFISKI